MQALSSYSSDRHSEIQAALQGLNDPTDGLMARSYFSERGLFANFWWPDWPEAFSKEQAAKVKAFHQKHPGLSPVEEGSPDWMAVFRGWRPDPPSVTAIAEAFSKHFSSRVYWVESEMDMRGRIAGRCMVEGIGEVTLHLSWRDSAAVPPWNIPESDRKAFHGSVKEVFAWAGRRIQPILDELHQKLETLYGERFRGLYVYGSYARADAGIELPEDSDLDVALLLSDFSNAYDELKRFGDVTSDLSLQHGLVVSVVPVLEADFREGRTNFARVISEYAIPV